MKRRTIFSAAPLSIRAAPMTEAMAMVNASLPVAVPSSAITASRDWTSVGPPAVRTELRMPTRIAAKMSAKKACRRRPTMAPMMKATLMSKMTSGVKPVAARMRGTVGTG